MAHFFKALCLVGFMSFATMHLPVHAADQMLRGSKNTMDTQSANNALSLLMSAFAASNQSEAEKLVDPQMIGYSRVMDGVRDVGIVHKQIRMALSDINTQALNDVVIIQAHWEMRSVQAPAMSPSRRTGTCIFVMRHEGVSWKLSALSGDNPFGFD